MPSDALKPSGSVAAIEAMDNITFVTGNAGKVAEMRALLEPRGISVTQNSDGYPEIQSDRLAAVAQAGAGYLLATGLEPPFILEDAGLFVDALGGFPGVYSAYVLDTIGLDGILELMAKSDDRSAHFSASLLFVGENGHMELFEGKVAGKIAPRIAGKAGFGFDPIFVPTEGDGRTFGEMTDAEKGKISHRGRATMAFLARLDETANP